MAKKETVTPVRRQYLELKRRYPNAILFFRLGDFYETFDEDAEIVSRELDIVLTSRNVAKGVRVPMAGIPYHAVEGYLAKLIAKGYHVAIAEQIGEPGKGLMRREVVRVVTPGTVVEPNLVPAESNNYLLAMVGDDRRLGIAYADITTGEFATTEIATPDPQAVLRAELLRLRPAEILHPEDWPPPPDAPGHTTAWPTWRFEAARCEETLRAHFEVSTLDGFGLRGKPFAVRAAGAILQYLQETQPAALPLLTRLSTYSLQEFMVLDAATRRNLELTETLREGSVQGSLLGVLDRTVTPMGKRLMRQWVSKPLLDVARIRRRQEGVAHFFTASLVRAEVRQALRRIGDLERLTNRILSGTAQPRDLVALRETLRHLPALRQALPPEAEAPLGEVLQALAPCHEVLSLLERAIAEDPPATLQNTGVIRPGFSTELDRIIRDSQHARDYIANLEQVERQRTGIKNLKVGYNKVFGYYIEVTKANAHLVPSHYIRKQTLVNAERYITPEMKEYEALVLNAEERIREIEGRLFKRVCDEVGQHASRLLRTARAVARLDVLAALAEAAVEGDYTRPEVVEEDVLEIYDGRHPVVERTLEGERFVPNDTVFEEGERIRILTGPNMAGKSTYLRQVALIVLMAQMGSFVPARKARIGVVDRIFTRIGAQDEIHAGQSTFMVEMIETANILHHATPRSLLILDEIGRGTSTYDGLAIAWAVVEYIHNHPRLRAKTLFATHYHELTQLADLLPGVRNYNVAVSESEGQVVFLHKIVPGGADRSYGVHVAQLAGLPKPVIQRAQELLEQFERQGGRAVRPTPASPQQLALFPETNPLLDELRQLDINNLTPIEALNRLYEWKRRFLDEKGHL
ncbi:MAG TPA: DNA mismatch repair protein MutS [Anaerolineae bacterium]|nr:DNA mismatch repair protein MutS [Anaerolineae bacterium]HID84591.1 DNA mismatch repair protein MutS [Anaerolineales bacterium]HIQ09555.1 DNA mismatch repair protein MutS [Anaerolineaceae bacterium]